MTTSPIYPAVKPALPIWWTLWAALLGGLVLIWWFFGFLKLLGNQPHANPLIDLVGVVPLFISIIIRWLVVPRAHTPRTAFVLFLTGTALAEACGILGVVLGGPYRDELFLLGVLGIAQYMPFFARRLLEPQTQGFVPNN